MRDYNLDVDVGRHPEADENGRIFIFVHPAQLEDLRGTPKQRYELKRRLERAKARKERKKDTSA